MSRSAKTEYACLAMLELARHFASGRPVRVREIADRHAIPSQFLVQILQQLKRAEMVASTRGAGGGYRLTQPPEQFSLGDVVTVVEGRADLANRVDLADQNGRSELAFALDRVFSAANDALRDELDRVSLADLIEHASANHETMYFI